MCNWGIFTGLGIVGVAVLAMADTSPPIDPDDTTTPGVVAETDVNNVCSMVGGSYSVRHRHTSEELKREIRQRDHAVGRGEVDHRVPLCLGGADVKENLWWQADYKKKDELEAHACHEVCTYHVPLNVAQSWFLAPAKWQDAYLKVFGNAP